MGEVADYLGQSMRLDETLAHVAEQNDRLLAELSAAGLQNDQLQAALISRLIIGQAQGILMERLNVSADQAFQYLKRASMQLNRKVIDIATEITSTRELPALD